MIRLRRLLVVPAALLAFGTARASDCAAVSAANYKSGCGSVGLSSSRVKPGDQLTVTCNYGYGGVCSSGQAVSCSYALPDVLVDGQPVHTSGGFPPMYGYDPPYPSPAGGAVVQLPSQPNDGSASHTVVFTIDPRAPNDCVKISSDGRYAAGPWVSLGIGSYWSTPVPFEVDRNAGRGVSCSLGAQTDAPNVVRAGKKIKYTVTATADDTASPLVIASPLPTGTVLVGVPSDGGAFKNGDVVWSFADVKEKTVDFTVQVKETKDVKHVKQIACSARARAKFGKSTASDEARIFTKLLKATQVFGVVTDVRLDFPRRTNVDEKRPAAQVEVRLFDGGGNVLDETKTDGGGRYEVESGDAGTFKVQFRKLADQYQSGADAVQTGVVPVIQERDVVFPVGEQPPTELNVALPWSLVQTTATTLRDLNQIKSDFAGIVTHTFRFDTSQIEATLQALLDSKERFDGVFGGGATPRDGWNALIRLDASLPLFKEHFEAAVQAGDDAAKSISLTIFVQLMSRLRGEFATKLAGIAKPGDTLAPSVMSKSVETAKIATLAYLVGVVVPPVLNALPLSTQERNFVLELTYKLVRFGANLFVPDANRGDIVFEVLFQATRTAIFELWTTEYRVETQSLVDKAQDHFAKRFYGDDTNATLAALEAFHGKVADRTKQLHLLAVDALKKISLLLRGPEGILNKLEGAIGIGALPDTGRSALAAGLKTFNEVLKKYTAPVTLTAFGLSIAAPIGTRVLVTKDMETEIDGAFAGMVPGNEPVALPRPPDAFLDFFQRIPGFRRGTVRPRSVRAPADAAVAALRDLFDEIDRDVKKGDVAAYAGLRADLLAKYDAAMDHVVTEGERCAALPWDDSRISDCVLARQASAAMLAGVLVDLEVWAIEPVGANAASARRSLADARTALLAAAFAIEDAQASLSGRAVPARLLLVGGVTTRVPPGSAFTTTFTVRNVGGTAASAGTAQLFPVDGLTLVGAATRPVAALAPGGTTTVSWQLTAPSGGAQLSSYEIVVTTPDAPSAGTEDALLIGP